MKLRILLSIVAFAGFLGQATAAQIIPSDRFLVRNPLIRVCTINGGLFETYPFGADQIALCRFGSLVVDSQTLLSNLNGIQTEAAGVIMSGTQSQTCEPVGATTHRLVGLADFVCVFGDDSKLGLSVLQTSPAEPERIRLKDVLLAR